MYLSRELKAIEWLFLVAGGVSRFAISNPRSIPRTVRWGFGNMAKLPQKIQHKVSIDICRSRLQAELDGINRLFEQNNGLRNSTDLKSLGQKHETMGLTRWELLYILVRAANCRSVVETGVAEGQSTAHILRALADNGGGILHSIDLPNQFYVTDSGEVHAEFNAPDAEPGCLVPQELRRNWRLTLGSSRDKLQKVLDEYGEIDVFFHDSEHTSETMTFEYETAWPYIRHGGYLVSDDATWNFALTDFAKRHDVEAVVMQGADYGVGFIRKL